MGVSRRAKRDATQAAAIETKKANKVRKDKERARRDARMLEAIRAGSLPYTPVVMSWLSAKLGKPSTKITPEDVAGLTS